MGWDGIQRDINERHGAGGHGMERPGTGYRTARLRHGAAVRYGMVRDGTVRLKPKREGTSRDTRQGTERSFRRGNGMVRYDGHGTVQYRTEPSAKSNWKSQGEK